MKLDNYLKKYEENKKVEISSKISNERQDLIRQFLERINTFRKEDGFQPLTGQNMAVILSKVPTSDLWAFYKQCDQANHFGKYFWWSIKTK